MDERKIDTSEGTTGARHLVEPDNPPTRKLFLELLALAVLLVGVLVALWQFFLADTAAEIYRKELSVPNRELQELVARDEGRLSEYGVVDEKKGLYQIPVKRAMEMIVEDPTLLAPAKAER